MYILSVVTTLIYLVKYIYTILTQLSIYILSVVTTLIYLVKYIYTILTQYMYIYTKCSNYVNILSQVYIY